jgi:hypothetical protein
MPGAWVRQLMRMYSGKAQFNELIVLPLCTCAPAGSLIRSNFALVQEDACETSGRAPLASQIIRRQYFTRLVTLAVGDRLLCKREYSTNA